MTFPETHAAIRRMIPQVALADPMPKSIVRKGLNLLFRGVAPVAQATTIIDAYVIPETDPLNYQWRVDLSPYTHIRIATRSYVESCFLFYSRDLTSALEPFDYHDSLSAWGTIELVPGTFVPIFVIGDRQIQQVASDPLFWVEIPEDLRTDLRLIFSLDNSDEPTLVPPSSIDGPFNVAIQVY